MLYFLLLFYLVVVFAVALLPLKQVLGVDCKHVFDFLILVYGNRLDVLVLLVSAVVGSLELLFPLLVNVEVLLEELAVLLNLDHIFLRNQGEYVENNLIRPKILSCI